MSDDDRYLGWHFSFREQWSQFFQSCNWYDFRIIHLEVERDVCMGGWDFGLTVLGLGVIARWNYEVTDAAAEVLQRVAHHKAGNADIATVWTWVKADVPIELTRTGDGTWLGTCPVFPELGVRGNTETQVHDAAREAVERRLRRRFHVPVATPSVG